MIEVTLEHTWSKETRTFEAENITRTTIDVHWPLSGNYIIDLKTNTLKARSIAARRKSPFVNWHVVDIDVLRRKVWEHFNPRHVEQARSIAHYMNPINMPFARPKVLSSSKG